MRTFLFLFLMVSSLISYSQDYTTPETVISCLEKITQTEPYKSNFSIIENNLLKKGYLPSPDGKGYRQLVDTLIKHNDLSILLPNNSKDLIIPQENYDCGLLEVKKVPDLLIKFHGALFGAEAIPFITPAILGKNFLRYFDDDDWDQPLTRHLFLFYVVSNAVQDHGISVKLPEWSEEEPDLSKVKSRNILTVMVNKENQLLVRGKAMKLNKLRKYTKKFIANPNKNPKLAEKPSKAIISLRNDRETEYGTYLRVYNELKAAYDELWDELAKKKFGKPYNDELPLAMRKEIRAEIPFVISEAAPTSYDEKN